MDARAIDSRSISSSSGNPRCKRHLACYKRHYPRTIAIRAWLSTTQLDGDVEGLSQRASTTTSSGVITNKGASVYAVYQAGVVDARVIDSRSISLSSGDPRCK